MIEDDLPVNTAQRKRRRKPQQSWKNVGLGGPGVPCSLRDPRLAGSNPAEVDGFFQDVKILTTSPPGGTLGWSSLKKLKSEKIGLSANFNRHIYVLVISKFGGAQ